MTSRNEPGSPDASDSSNGDSSGERAGAHRAAPPGQAGRGPDGTEAPPWQRGVPRAPHAAHRQPPEAPAEPRTSSPPSGIDARLSRFISGTSAPTAGTSAAGASNPPTQELEAVPARGEGPPAEAYASELPDLSGPVPRTPPRKPAPAPDTGTASAPGKARSTAAAARESRETRVQVSRRGRGPVRASMQIRRIDPWSTLKVSLLLSVAVFFVWMIAVAFLYLVLGGMGVWAKLNSNVGDLLNNTSGSSGELISSGTIFGGAVLIGLVNIVLMTAMATIAAFVYNLTTDLIGGIEVTLADRD
ncbi:MAG: DUF3566 domain-containing protein [Mycobacterium sp.]|uniref:DUF3566 domain-containing protein n=1 Tax=Mycobacterium sp. TaxID=1785 RepID=UPI001EB41C6B|nr:DUF3566 domain-containing protein [Mycobacterium sp.]MBW0016620.1 DUF3566 domain-containing protein [Mycobacterium sp.]